MGNNTSCAESTEQLTAFQLALLPEPDRDVVSEHLDSCASCRIFSEQIEQTTQLLESFPQTGSGR
jgi:predicted anti-sigma-YlaC factor YlaD